MDANKDLASWDEPAKTQEITLASWTRGVKQSTIQQMLTVATQPGILSFALGLPAAELFPSASYAQATALSLATDPHALQYGPPWQPLKRHIVGLMALRGVHCREEQVFLTTGAQQGMSLMARLLLDFQGTILLERTIYSGVLQAVESLQPTLLAVPTDAQTGMDVEAVASLLAGQRRPAFIYAISDGHNPLGISLSQEKRYRLVELARYHHIPILEDDAYGLLSYDREALLPMRALDDQWVFYLGSFSKILAPALRVGWIIVPERFIPALSALKEGSDINTATFAQRTIAAYLEMGQLPDHLGKLRRAYQSRRDAMLHALETSFPSDARWSMPTSGMFIWVEIPGEVDMGEVLKAAIEKEQVVFIPGHAFDLDESRHSSHCMRLNFSNCDVKRIDQGIARLGRIIQEAR